MTLAALRWLHAGESVILYGPVGVGKTHVAQALGHMAIRHGADVRFAKSSRVLADLAGGHADGTWGRRLRELARPPVLILDDFGMREVTAPPSRRPLRTHQRTRRPLPRAHQQPIIGRLVPVFPNAVVAESLLDRLINTSHQVFMNGPSYRPNKRPRSVADDKKKTTG